jgi:hypothetical protein
MGFVIISNLLVPIWQGNQIVHSILFTPQVDFNLFKKFNLL